jgi:hypothetical protein
MYHCFSAVLSAYYLAMSCNHSPLVSSAQTIQDHGQPSKPIVEEIREGFYHNSGVSSLRATNVVKNVVPVLNLIKHYAMKAYGGVDV